MSLQSVLHYQICPLLAVWLIAAREESQVHWWWQICFPAWWILYSCSLNYTNYCCVHTYSMIWYSSRKMMLSKDVRSLKAWKVPLNRRGGYSDVQPTYAELTVSSLDDFSPRKNIFTFPPLPPSPTGPSVFLPQQSSSPSFPPSPVFHQLIFPTSKLFSQSHSTSWNVNRSGNGAGGWGSNILKGFCWLRFRPERHKIAAGIKKLSLSLT